MISDKISFPDSSFARITVRVSVVLAFLMPVAFIFLMDTGMAIAAYIKKYPAVFLGIPWSGGAASVIVLMFDQFSGELNFKALGFEFKGAAVPAIFWVICFLAFIVAIKVLMVPDI